MSSQAMGNTSANKSSRPPVRVDLIYGTVFPLEAAAAAAAFLCASNRSNSAAQGVRRRVACLGNSNYASELVVIKAVASAKAPAPPCGPVD